MQYIKKKTYLNKISLILFVFKNNILYILCINSIKERNMCNIKDRNN